MKKWSIEKLSLAAIAILLPILGALAALDWQQDQGGYHHYAHLPLLLAGVGAALLSKVLLLRQLRRRGNQRLAHSERRYRQLVETALEGIWLADADGHITYANVRSAEMVGYLPAELLGRHVNDFIDAPPGRIHCDIYEYPEQDIRQLRDLRYRTRDGLPGWALVRSQTLRDDDGRFAGALVMVSDITARKLGEQELAQAHAELELRIASRTAELETAVAQLREEIAVRHAAEQARARSDSRLHEIISMMPLSLFIKDADSRIVLMNKACEQSWDLSLDSMLGQQGSPGLPPALLADFLAKDRAAFERRELIVTEEAVWNARCQESRYLRTYKKPVFDADGRPQMLICMSVDISESKLAEAALQQSLRQLRALSDHHHAIKAEERRRIALDIHDELGQNLMALKIDVSLLHARTGAAHPRLHARAAAVLTTLDATIRAARGIINELHPTALALGLHAAIEWLMQQIERRDGLRCQLDLIDVSADALLDARQTAAIFRVVQEALSNVRVYAGATEVDVSLNLHPQRLTIVVNDDGAGPADDELVRAAAFSHNAIKERVAAMGGELVEARRRGGGSTLSILLPGVAALIEQELLREALP